MRWIRLLNVRTVKLLILTAIVGAVVIYDYTYISQLHSYKDQSDDIELVVDISQNKGIQSYSPQQSDSRSQTPSDTETVNVSDSSYVRAIEDIMSGEMTPAKHVKSQSASHINLGLILINLSQNTTELSKKFTRRVNKMFRSMFMFWTESPLHIIVVTDRDSVRSVATFMGRMMMKETAERVFTTKSFLWRRVDNVPRVKVNYVDYKEILQKNKPFSKRLIAVQAQTKDNKTVDEDKYLAELFYIAPIYHLGFPALDKILVIDGTDLEFHDDIKLLYDQFKHVTKGKLIGLGLDLSPNYFKQLETYRIFHPDNKAGLAGPTQGFNTGVVLYNLEAMRRSTVYNSYLSPAMVDMIVRKFMYDYTLAEQDWFTSLSFLHPDLFYVLPCKFNRQTSIQYLQPPWEEIFESFHDCSPKEDVVIFHSNGCGPFPESCGVDPTSANYTGTYWRNRTKYWKDIHLDFQYFWPALAGLDY